MVIIECKDLDGIREEDICEALGDQLKLEDIQETDVKNLRRAYGETQTATLTRSVALAMKGLSAGKVRVGCSFAVVVRF